MWFRVIEFYVQGLGFRMGVHGLGLGVYGSWLRVSGLGFRF
jgi:hypothetical protein